MSLESNSLLSGFYKLSQPERIQRVASLFNLSASDLFALQKEGSLPHELSDLFVENSLGNFPMPFGLVTNINMNGKEYAAPFAVEESSVIAASSNAAKWIKSSGGFKASCLESLMIGQIQILDVAPNDMVAVTNKILSHQAQLIEKANSIHPRLQLRGGGTRRIEVRSFPEAEIPFMVVHILMDTQEAMGANLVNTVCEQLANDIEQLCDCRIGIRILSNYADQKLFRAQCRVNPDLLALNNEDQKISGAKVAERIVEAYIFAKHDPYRAATHNKGIMNGVDPLVIATGNDWRAVEAGVHAYASRTGRYQSLSSWSIDDEGYLIGELTLPLQLGTVGGVTRLHPLSQVSLKILGEPNAMTLSQLACCTGLAANLAALRALVTTGIQAGHMKLHSKNLALAAGARGSEIETVAAHMVRQNELSQFHAENILRQIREQKTETLCFSNS